MNGGWDYNKELNTSIPQNNVGISGNSSRITRRGTGRILLQSPPLTPAESTMCIPLVLDQSYHGYPQIINFKKGFPAKKNTYNHPILGYPHFFGNPQLVASVSMPSCQQKSPPLRFRCSSGRATENHAFATARNPRNPVLLRTRLRPDDPPDGWAEPCRDTLEVFAENRGTQIAGWFMMDNSIEMDNLEVPPF